MKIEISKFGGIELKPETWLEEEYIATLDYEMKCKKKVLSAKIIKSMSQFDPPPDHLRIYLTDAPPPSEPESGANDHITLDISP